MLGFSDGERIRGWSMATGGGCGVVAGVNTVLKGSVDGSCGGLRLGDCVQRLELRMVDTQRLELKLVDFGRWQLDGGGVVGRYNTGRQGCVGVGK